jgi:hypothetical protein
MHACALPFPDVPRPLLSMVDGGPGIFLSALTSRCDRSPNRFHVGTRHMLESGGDKAPMSAAGGGGGGSCSGGGSSSVLIYAGRGELRACSLARQCRSSPRPVWIHRARSPLLRPRSAQKRGGGGCGCGNAAGGRLSPRGG